MVGLRQPQGRRAPLVEISTTLYYQALVVLLGFWAARIGNWAGLFHHYAGERLGRARAVATVMAAALALWLYFSQRVPLVGLLYSIIPQGVQQGGGNKYLAVLISWILYAVAVALIIWPFARVGEWSKELVPLLPTRLRSLLGRGAPAPERPRTAPTQTGPAPAEWPELRAAGRTDAAEALTAAVRTGRMNDVDCVRLRHAWAVARTRADRLESFAETVLRKGPTAYLHPSGDRDLPLRTAPHDPLTGQVRIGDCADDPRNPYPRRGSGMALEPASLGTSLLAVGPPGSGKTAAVVRPVIESLAIRALTGQAAVLAVGGAGAQLGPDDAYDVVVRIGDPASAHDFDLYGGTTDPDEAAATLAEGLAGDLPGLDSRRAGTVLGQLLGPYRTVHGRFPGVPELRELLEGSVTALTALRQALEAGGEHTMLRELDARARQAGGAGDPAAVLADRIAVLDRPAFAGFFSTGEDARPFSLRSLEQHPLRVRIDLPERAHAEASHVLARLVLAQFNAITAPAPTAPCSSAWSWTTPPTPSPPRPSGASGGCGPSTRGRSSRCGPWTTCPRRCTPHCSVPSAATWPSRASPPGTANASPRYGARSGSRSGRSPSTASSPTSRSPAPCTPCGSWPPARPSPRTP